MATDKVNWKYLQLTEEPSENTAFGYRDCPATFVGLMAEWITGGSISQYFFADPGDHEDDSDDEYPEHDEWGPADIGRVNWTGFLDAAVDHLDEVTFHQVALKLHQLGKSGDTPVKLVKELTAVLKRIARMAENGELSDGQKNELKPVLVEIAEVFGVEDPEQ